MKRSLSLALVVCMLIHILTLTLSAFAVQPVVPQASAADKLIPVQAENVGSAKVYRFASPMILTQVSFAAAGTYTIEYTANGTDWTEYIIYNKGATPQIVTDFAADTTCHTRSTYPVTAIRVTPAVDVTLWGYAAPVTAGSSMVPWDVNGVFYSAVYKDQYNPAAVFNYTIGSNGSTDASGGIFVSENAVQQYIGCKLTADTVITDITFSARRDKAVASSRYNGHVFKASAVGDVNGDGKIDAADIAQWDTIAAIADGFATDGKDVTVFQLPASRNTAYRYVAYYCESKAYLDIAAFEVYGKAQSAPAVPDTPAEPTGFTVTFAFNDGSERITTMTTAADGTLAELPPVSDERFIGWFTAQEGGAQVEAGNTVFTSAAIVYAQYKAVTVVPSTGPGADVMLMALAMRRSQRFGINAAAGEGGTITPAGDTKVKYDTSQTYTITPADGYIIEAVLVNGQDVGAVTEYTFKRVRMDQSILVIFAGAE